MLSKKIFIVIEGIDGAGKTEVAKKIADAIGAAFYQTPAGPWRKYRWLVEDSNTTIRFIFYLLATIYSSTQISFLLRRKNVICDRYIYSTWAHHIAYGLKILAHIPCSIIPIKKPDIIFYLYVDSEEREQRLKNRLINTKKDKDSKKLQEVHECFCSLAVNMQYIDTTQKNIEQVVNCILSHLENS